MHLNKSFQVWRDNRVEVNWSKEIASNLADSDVLLLVWTDQTKDSEMVKRERLVAQALEKTIKPIIFADSPKLPEKIANLQAMKLDVSSAELKSNKTPSFPRSVIDIEFSRLIERLQNQSYHYRHPIDSTLSKSNLSYLPDPNFVGRREQLMNLYLFMIGELNNISSHIVSIFGLPGIGKTELAVEFAYRFSEEFPLGIYWIQGSEPDKWLSQLVRIARDYLKLEISISLDLSKEEENIRYAIEFKNYCSKIENKTKMLLIIDNVDDPKLLNDPRVLLKSSDVGIPLLALGCDMIFTTKRHFDLPNVKGIEIPPRLSDDASYILLTEGHRPPADDDEKEFAQKICKAVGNMALAIAMIKIILSKRDDITYQQYYEILEKENLAAIDQPTITPEELATRHLASIELTFDQLWELVERNISEISQKASKGTLGSELNIERMIEFIQLVTLFPESSIIPKRRLFLFFGDPEIKSSTSLLEQENELYLNKFKEFFIFEKLGKEQITLHPLLREYSYKKFFSKQADLNKIINKALSSFNINYDNFSRLVDEYNERGINEILNDFDVASNWSQLLKNSSNKISKDTIQVLRYEQHNFKKFEREEDSTYKKILFAQHFQVRSKLMGYDSLAKKAEEFLLQIRDTFHYLGVNWISSRNSSIFYRTLNVVNNISAMAFIPQNNRIACGTFTGTVIVYDISNGEEVLKIQAYKNDSVSSLFASGEDRLVSAGSLSIGGGVKVFDTRNGNELCKHKTDSHPFRAFFKMKNAFTGTSNFDRALEWVDTKIPFGSFPDGDMLLFGSFDLTLLDILECKSEKMKLTIHASSWADRISSITLTPDGEFLISGHFNGLLQILNLETGELRKIHPHEGTIHAMAITTDGENKLITTGHPGSSLVPTTHMRHIRVFDDKVYIKIIDVNKGEQIKQIAIPKTIHSFVITSDNRRIVSSNFEGIKIWDIYTSEEIYADKNVGLTSLEAIDILIRSDKDLFYYDGNAIRIADMNTIENQLANNPGNNIDVIAITRSKREILAYSSIKNVITAMHIDTGEEVLRFSRRNRSTLKSFAVTSYERKIVSIIDRKIVIERISDREVIDEIQVDSSIIFDRHIFISPDDEKAIISAFEFQKENERKSVIKIFDLKFGQEIRTITPNYAVGQLAITSDGKKVIVGCLNKGDLEVFDIETGEEIKKLKIFQGGSYQLSNTPVASKLACHQSILAGNATIKIIDTNSWQEVTRMDYFGDPISIGITPDDNKMVIADNDGTVRVVDISINKIVSDMPLGEGISSVSIIDDQKFVIMTRNNQIISFTIS